MLIGDNEYGPADARRAGCVGNIGNLPGFRFEIGLRRHAFFYRPVY